METSNEKEVGENTQEEYLDLSEQDNSGFEMGLISFPSEQDFNEALGDFDNFGNFNFNFGI